MNNKTKLLLTFILITAFSNSGLFAQTFEEYKKQQEQEMQNFKDLRQQELKNLANEFDDFVKKQDQEFTEYLKEHWKQFEVFQGITPPEDPKPDIAPICEKPERPAPPEAIPTKKPVLESSPTLVPEPILPRVTRQEPTDFPLSEADYIFYGFPLILDYDKKMLDVQLNGNLDEETISDVFQELSSTNYNELVDQLFNYAQLFNLNDWGYYMLTKHTSESLFPNNENTQRLFNWFLMIRSGYKAKVAYYEDKAYLLLPIQNQVYGVKFFMLDGQKYYLMDGDVGNIFTYKNDLPDAQKLIDLNLFKCISLGEETNTTLVDFEYQGIDYSIPVEYNTNIIEFYQDYPLADIKMYFDAVVSPETKSSLTYSLLPLIKDKSELEAVNFLLHFVQTGFEYQTDQEQFGFEKFFFAEEAFHYPYCDCEDRSVLFAYLVQNLMGLEAVGLNYPGHIATAIHFNEEVSGDYLSFEGKKYIVSDPTYINAPVGLTMPEYKNVQAEIISLDNNYAEGRNRSLLWNEVMAAGGMRGDNRRDLIMNDDGSGILTGYFTDSFSYGNIDVSGSEQASMFTMMVDANKKPLWFSSSEGSGMALSYGIARDNSQNIYITGTFEGEMEVDGNLIKTSGNLTDIFLAKYDPRGQLKWLKNANIDTAATGDRDNNFLDFVITFDPSGKHLKNELYFSTPDFGNYGISIKRDGEIAIAGSFNKTTGFGTSEISFDAEGEFDIIQAMKSENDRLIQENYEKTIAGLFAVVNLVQSSGVSIPGSAARDVLDTYNPHFKQEFPEIYKTIQKIHFIKNQDGIISIKTDNKKDISIDLMRIRNDAKFKVSTLENGDARIDVLSGIIVGRVILWYDLNYILMHKQDGDLLFDYDSDHNQRTQNLRIDILH